MGTPFDGTTASTGPSSRVQENRQKAAEIQLTSGLLPVIVPVVEHLGEFAVKVGEIASEYPGVTTVIGGSIAIISGAGMAFSLLGGAIEGAKLAYNTIEFAVDDYNSPEVKEILEQPYIVSVRITKIKDNTKVRRLKRYEYNTNNNSN